MVLRPMRSPARPKPSEKLESMIDPIKPIHWTAAKLVLNSFWIAESNTPILPTLCMWKNVPRQTTRERVILPCARLNPLNQNEAQQTIRDRRKNEKKTQKSGADTKVDDLVGGLR